MISHHAGAADRLNTLHCRWGLCKSAAKFSKLGAILRCERHLSTDDRGLEAPLNRAGVVDETTETGTLPNFVMAQLTCKEYRFKKVWQPVPARGRCAELRARG